MKYKRLTPQEKVLQELAAHGGSIPRYVLICHTKMEQSELDLVLEKMEREGKIKLTNLVIGEHGFVKQMIVLKCAKYLAQSSKSSNST